MIYDGNSCNTFELNKYLNKYSNEINLLLLGDYCININYFGQSLPSCPIIAKGWDVSKVKVNHIALSHVGVQSNFSSKYYVNTIDEMKMWIIWLQKLWQTNVSFLKVILVNAKLFYLLWRQVILCVCEFLWVSWFILKTTNEMVLKPALFKRASYLINYNEWLNVWLNGWLNEWLNGWLNW